VNNFKFIWTVNKQNVNDLSYYFYIE
jgi:hypothetical protein